MFKAGGLDAPGAGLMWVTPIDKAATHVPEDVLRELRAAGKWKEA